jgi:EAL domain-containing protein (putative c-di-GMP-specific phosphodiesterase class I)
VHPLQTLNESVSLSSTIARKILAAFDAPFQIDGRELYTTASIGIACYPSDGESSSNLLRNADAAMYHAKALGKNAYHFYSNDLNARALERLDLENHLRRALERQEFELYFQPKVAASDGRMRSAEALVRWNHPERGRVSPLDFIPLCEELGLIIPLGTWIIETVCGSIRQWADQGLEPVRIAVNLSPLQFRQPDLPLIVRRIIEETGIQPDRLEFEITESAAMEYVDKSISTLQELREIGIHISLDDFGTGFSSLSYLKQLPLNTLKIDQSFIRNLSHNTQDRAIVESIITLAHTLNFTVVAEGVEDQDQLQILRGMSCDEIQGYLFSPPVSLDLFAQMLANERSEGGPVWSSG